ncbi:SusC/RagA family TonB-linked outer membrane protein [Dyadobacter sediminis]|uniref:SusC/RagA family TonB-linked outer membrane protein n=1 Tax=Dyadobacter sediminis TaxID=1493691 RepID=A0A5R9KJM4_9BACT|nr:SusC/RagA family TonB-linked outer membrane protein [Dyadobacter sediminis]TLU96420.1 SusC/RagA family TonB-linked outer membrane protein [Dyadobacter sediminis]GGB82086.1 SusC/RagA family TonB-linked outer membrane protein [Dyadobacter sediminis]
MNKNLVFIFLLFSIVHASFAQNISVTGRVTSRNDNEALPGVTILIKGSSKGTATDIDGRYTIDAASGATLIFSFIGLKSTELTVPENGKLDVQLESDETILQEVVVTALGIAKEKKSLGYAVQELQTKDIAEARENNLVNALSGKIAGVNITNSQGGMGSSRIVIRGETSIAGNNQPLFVVDGIPIDNSQLGAGSVGSRDFANAISDINPNDIESISVLKGPNAAALYGSRASNGVILIKTKSGKGTQKGLGVNVNFGYTFDKLLVLPEYQNVYGQGTGGAFSYVNGKGGGINDATDESWGPKMDGRLIPQFFSNGEPAPFVAHPDNVKNFFETGHTRTTGVSVSGSNEKLDYRFSFNNSKQTGVIPNTDISKNAFGVNTTYRLNDKLTLTTSANFSRNSSDNLPGTSGRGSSVMLQFLWFGRQVDTELLKDYNKGGFDYNWNHSYYSNPYLLQYENTVQQRRDRFFGNVNLNYKITDWLTATVRTGNDYYNDKRKFKVAYGTNGTPFGSYTEDSYIVNENNTDFNFNFHKNVSADFELDWLVGGNLRSNFNEQNYQQAPKLAVSGLYTLNNSRDPLVSSNVLRKQKVYSAFSSAQLGFRNYAFLNLTARNDWSSTLPTGNNSYFYPSVNASLVLTDAFNIKSNVLTYAKLRGGWAQVGKDTDPYQLINTYPFNQPFGSNPLLTVSDVLLNADLKPEITKSTEVGADVALFKNRVRLDVSYYNTDSYNQILRADVSPSTGYKQKLLNAGHINNKGFEAMLNVKAIETNAGFRWDVGINYSRNRSKVIALDDEGFLNDYKLGTNGVTVYASKGLGYGALFGSAFARNAAGEMIIGSTGIPTRDPNQKVLGHYQPKWIGGITNSFAFKGFNLSVLIDTKQGGSIYSATNATGRYTGVLASTLPGRDAEHGGLTYYYPGNNKSGVAVQIANAAAAPTGAVVYEDGIIAPGVTADGKPNTTIVSAERYYKGVYSNSAGINEASVFDASFIKLREVKLGYTVPQSFVSKYKLQSLIFSVYGRNLAFLQKKADNIDPETAFNTGNTGQGLESLQLPTTSSYGFNILIGF